MHIETIQLLADPVRLHIVDVLRSGEQSVNDIVGTVKIDQSGVSRHLRILHEGGFVDVRPDGQRRMYSLRPEPFRELDAWISGYRHLWGARLDRFGEALVRRQTAKVTSRKERKQR
jgi:DNA-binding transcriptional ArsR family regulator